MFQTPLQLGHGYMSQHLQNRGIWAIMQIRSQSHGQGNCRIVPMRVVVATACSQGLKCSGVRSSMKCLMFGRLTPQAPCLCPEVEGQRGPICETALQQDLGWSFQTLGLLEIVRASQQPSNAQIPFRIHQVFVLSYFCLQQRVLTYVLPVSKVEKH